MTSPQLENGYTRIANELLEALACLQLSGSEWSMVLCIIRKTYGYNKKSDWVTNSQIAKMSGLGETRISEAKGRLLEAGIITEKRKNVSLNKNYSEWQKLRKSVSEITEIRKKNYGNPYTQKKKDNNKRNSSETSSQKSNYPLKEIGMNWKNKSDDYEEGIVDYDGDGSVVDEEVDAKKTNRAEREKIKRNLKLVEEIRGLPYNPAALNADVKVYQQLEARGWTGRAIIEEYVETIESDYWKEKRQHGEYPSLMTVEFRLRNKKPQ